MHLFKKPIHFFASSLILTNFLTTPTPPVQTPTSYPQQLAVAYPFLLAEEQGIPSTIEQKQIALTFDADMTYGMKSELEQGIVESWYNRELITVLEKHHAKATLFLTGMWAEVYPNEAKQLAQNPLFEIGNHSYDHMAFTANCYGLPAISDSEDEANIQKSQEVLSHIIGYTPTLFRFPGLCHDEPDMEAVKRYGLTVIDGNVTADDGFTQDTQRIVQEVLSQVKPGAIVVAHMHGGTIAPKTAEAMDQIIPELVKQGYTFVTVSELGR